MDRKSRTSRSATLDDTNEEVSLWKQICNSLAKLEGIQKDAGNVVTNINSIHGAVNFDEGFTSWMDIINSDNNNNHHLLGISSVISQRLISEYKGGIELSTSETKIIHDIIEKLSVLIALRDASEYNVIDQKRKKRRAEQEESSNVVTKKVKTSGILSPGASVAAKQPKQKDKNEEWILAVVISYHTDKNKYQVEDVDQDEYGERQRYMLQPRNVIRVPHRDEAKALPEYNTGHDVLALYPGTTCFYRATVMAPPSKNKDATYGGNYKVQFEDDNDEYKYVSPEHVLELPKIK